MEYDESDNPVAEVWNAKTIEIIAFDGKGHPVAVDVPGLVSSDGRSGVLARLEMSALASLGIVKLSVMIQDPQQDAVCVELNLRRAGS